MSSSEQAFIRSLLALTQEREGRQGPDRAALAALRSGLGKPPGTAARMFPLVAPYMVHERPAGETNDPYGQEMPAWNHAVFLTAALFAKHPMHATGNGITSLGASLRKSVKSSENSDGKHNEDGVAARLTAALDAHPEDLPRHLETLITLCESAAVPVNWDRFFNDVRALLSTNDRWRDSVRRNWARDFWQGPRKSDEANADNA